MRWRNEQGDASSRDISRPEVVEAYYAVNNVIDVHNQLQQYQLKLEKEWVTKDCWFLSVHNTGGHLHRGCLIPYQNRDQ